MNSFRRPLLVAFLLATVLAASCSSFESCGSEQSEEVTETDEPQAQAQPADVGQDTRAEELAEAQKAAEKFADSAAFNLEQKARFMAAELEGLEKESEKPKVKKAPQPKDDGKIDVQKVQQVFSQHRGELQKCYERALKRDPALAGQVILTVRISTSGKPSLIQARSDQINDDPTLQCMERQAKSWVFPRPQGGTVLLNKPFRFAPQN